MDDPFFSVLIPVYRNIDFLYDCLQSIIHQSFENFEIIVCYQGDTNEGVKVQDRRIRYLYLERPSLYLARIESYKIAKGKYVLFVDSDDKLLDGALSNLFQVITQYANPDIIQFGYTSSNTLIENKSSPTVIDTMNKETYLSYYLSELGTYPVWRKCFKRNEIVFFDENVFLGEDALISLAFICKCSNVIRIENTLYYYRPNEKSGTSNLKVKHLDDLAIFIKHSFPYRNQKEEIEMGIYSFMNTFFVYHIAFPNYDFLSLSNVKEVVEMILAYDFSTSPRIFKLYFIRIVNGKMTKFLDVSISFLFKAMRTLRKRFKVVLNTKPGGK